jgi:IMP dehydrogenase/GMP reductase
MIECNPYSKEWILLSAKEQEERCNEFVARERNELAFNSSLKRIYNNISLKFNQVAIQQQKNICKSRLDVDVTSEVIKGINLQVPLIASNMSTVCNAEFCIHLHNMGAMGVMHRAGPKTDILGEIGKIKRFFGKNGNIAASVGTGQEQFYFAEELIDRGTNIIFVDIAHGYSDDVIEFGRKLKNFYPNIKVVLGNTTNINMLYEVADFADALKVGIAQGSACETKNTAGCTEGQFTAVLKFKYEAKRLGIPIISDGSVKEPADFVKAIGAGANSVMAGRIFAMCPESAAEVQEINGVKKKIYAGMASRYVQNRWKGGLKEGTCPEGGIRYLDLGESLPYLLKRYSGALKSGITYSGARNIKEFQEKVEFVRICGD